MKVKIEIEADHTVFEMVNYLLGHPIHFKDVDTKMIVEFREKLVESFLNFSYQDAYQETIKEIK